MFSQNYCTVNGVVRETKHSSYKLATEAPFGEEVLGTSEQGKERGVQRGNLCIHERHSVTGQNRRTSIPLCTNVLRPNKSELKCSPPRHLLCGEVST